MTEQELMKKAAEKFAIKEKCWRWFFKGIELMSSCSITDPEWMAFYRVKFEKMWV